MQSFPVSCYLLVRRHKYFSSAPSPYVLPLMWQIKFHKQGLLQDHNPATRFHPTNYLGKSHFNIIISITKPLKWSRRSVSNRNLIITSRRNRQFLTYANSTVCVTTLAGETRCSPKKSSWRWCLYKSQLHVLDDEDDNDDKAVEEGRCFQIFNFTDSSWDEESFWTQ